MVKEKIDTIEKLAALVVEKFEQIDFRFDESNQAIEHVQDELRTIRFDIKHIKSDVSEVKSEIKAHGRAIDKDSWRSYITSVA